MLILFFVLSQMETFAAKGAGAMPADNVIKFQPRRTPEPPLPKKAPMINAPTIVKGVIAVLILIHVVLWLAGREWQAWAQYFLAFNPARMTGERQIASPPGAEIWSFVTYALLHADAFHLFSNSIWLLIFSTPVCGRLGTVRYLIIVVATAIAGALAMLLTNWGALLVMIGASGSVSGLLAAVIPIMFAPGFQMSSAYQIDYRRLRVLTFQEVFQNSKALGFTALFLALTLMTAASSGLNENAFTADSAIAWQAHLGGFIAGFLMFYLLDRKPVSLH
jgi:membrane associated rhomboid family serine protease